MIDIAIKDLFVNLTDMKWDDYYLIGYKSRFIFEILINVVNVKNFGNEPWICFNKSSCVVAEINDTVIEFQLMDCDL